MRFLLFSFCFYVASPFIASRYDYLKAHYLGKRNGSRCLEAVDRWLILSEQKWFNLSERYRINKNVIKSVISINKCKIETPFLFYKLWKYSL